VEQGSAEPDVTVVVICYNDAGRLERAVRSVLDQSLRRVEAIIVDDASTDATPQVAARLVAEAPDRVRNIRLAANSGACGRPRNTGIAAARGRYVMFLDSDDTLDRHACRNMFAAAERASADLVVGRCVRHYVERGVDEDWLPWLFRRQAVYASLTDYPQLLDDVLSTNKCYRRDFLLREGLRFTEDRYYEDNLFSAHAYLTAKKIAVIPHRVYTWNVEKRASQPSMSVRSGELRNLRDRISINRDIDELMNRYGSPELRLRKKIRFIEHDLRIHLANIGNLPEEQRRSMVDTAAEYLAEFPDEVFEQAEPRRAIAAFMARERDYAGVASACDLMPIGGGTPRLTTDLVERDGRIYWCDRHLDDPLGRRVLDVTAFGWHRRPLADLDLGTWITETGRDAGGVRLAGELVNPLHRLPRDGRLRAVLRFTDRRYPHRRRDLPVELRHDAGRLAWQVTFDPARVLRPIGVIDPTWAVRLRLSDGHDTVTAPIFAGQDLLAELVFPVRPRLTRLVADTMEAYHTELGHIAFRLAARGAAARATARVFNVFRATTLGHRLWERCRSAERALRDRLNTRQGKIDAYNRIFLRLPVRRRSVVFESHMGKQYSDNPRYIYEELVRSGLNYECTWVYARSTAGFPKEARLVKRGSWAYYWALARARFWVDNQGMPPGLRKRAGTMYIQTWHGSAFKRMGFDEPSLKQAPRNEQHRLQEAVNRFDVFLVRSEHDVRTLARAFRLRAELLPVGYPRNDALVRGVDPKVLADLRKQLRIPDGRPVALYAPTFRPKPVQGRPEPPPAGFDLRRFADRFGDQLALLVRPHYLAKLPVPPGLPGTVLDVGHIHDVTPLLALADVLITDYSSVMFDYALLDRPMVFHVPDHADYVHRARGAYFDLAEHAPGPLTRDEDELFAALADLPALAAGYAERRRRFVERFGEYDTGTAAKAVVERYFATGGRRG